MKRKIEGQTKVSKNSGSTQLLQARNHLLDKIQSALAALAEVTSMRFVNGVRARTSLLGIDYPTTLWLYNDIGYRAYKIISVDALYNSFISMYFGAAYLSYLSEYEGRQRSYEFIVQVYLSGPENVNLQEHMPILDQIPGYFEIL